MGSEPVKEDLMLSAKDIAVILKACADSGVSTFQYGQLEISFEKKEDLPTQETLLTGFDPDEIPSNYFNQSSETTSTQKDKVDETDLEMLQITNPAAWEEYLTQENL